MKLLKDYSEQELTTLTPDEKNALFLIECAERGIALPSSIPAFMPSPEDRDDLKPDVTVYQLGGRYSSSNHYFKTPDEAQAVADLISRTSIGVGYDYRATGSNTYYISGKKQESIEVTPVQVFSADRYASLKQEIDRYASQKNIIESNNTRRQKILDEHSNLMSEIDKAIEEADRNITRLQEFAGIFAQYKAMANDDHTVAVRFLLNAHYSEVSDYDDDQLAKIGISRQDIENYNAASKPAETEE